MANVSLLQQMADKLVSSGATTDLPQGGQVQAASSSEPPVLPSSDVQASGQAAQADVSGNTPQTSASPPSQEPAPSPDIYQQYAEASPPKEQGKPQADKNDVYQQYSVPKIMDRSPIAPTGDPRLDDPMNPFHYLPASLQPRTSDMAYRFAEGLQNPVVGIGQAAANADSAVGLTPPEYAKQVNKDVTQRDKDYEANHSTIGPDIANIAGNIISPANALLPLEGIAKIADKGSSWLRAGKAALTGATQMTAQPTDTGDGVTYAGGKGLQVAEGAASAGAFSGAASAASSILKPAISNDVQTLLDHGIRVSTDQMSGTGGSKLTSVPIVGGLINESHNRAVEDLNTAVLNKALSPIGEQLHPLGPQSGNDALAYTRERLSNAYDTLLPKLSGNINDQTTNTLGQSLLTDSNHVIGGGQPMSFQQKFSQLMQDKYYGMHLDTTTQLGKFLTKEISGVVNNDGSFNGEQYKQIETGLNHQISNYSGSQNPQDRMMANALSDVKGLLKDQLSASNPEGAQQLQNINKGYSVFKTAQRAASSTAAPNGVFNPTQLYAAVKNSDKSLDKRAFTEGDLPLYDLASAAKNVLSDYRNSGTADRGLAAAAAGSLATGGASAVMAHPVGSALGALTAGYYTKPGQAAARYLMTARPAGASVLSYLAKKASDLSSLQPYAAIQK